MEYPEAERILGKYFPELMHPFILQQAKKMILQNILKLATGPDAQDKIDKVIFRFKSL